MLYRLFLLTVLAWSGTLHALLPLPYSPEPPPVALSEPGEVETVDPKTIPGYSELFSHGQTRAMELPAFGDQTSALGYEPGATFQVPDSLRPRVDFWKRIYTVYTSNQAVLHDSKNLQMEYAVLDLTRFGEDLKAMNRYMKVEKDKIVEQLETLDALRDNPQDVPHALFALYRKFDGNTDPDRFLNASENVRAQRGQSDKVVQGFLFGGRYWNNMTEILEQRSIPKELSRLPLVESTFNLAARSKVGASGVWQFMRATGKRFLRIDPGIDERNDPVTATWAAAELLRQNYETLESWPLAITAYNHGREGMRRAVQQTGSNDLADIIEKYESPSFGFASSNFYSEFLAILEVEREYRQHFGSLQVDAPLQFEEVASPSPITFDKLAERCGIQKEALAQLNPAFTQETVDGKLLIPAAYAVRVPVGARPACGLSPVEHGKGTT